jgi:aminoglycoside/choline kinase family phosphotransferase
VSRIASFLAESGFASSRLQWLPQDASFRRYARLVGGSRPAILMDSPPPEEVRPWLRVAAHLHLCGLSAPAVLAADAEAGLLLIEDFGDATFARLLLAGHDEAALYALAGAALRQLHDGPVADDLPAWNAPRLAELCAATLLDWWWPAAQGAPCPAWVRAEFHEAALVMLAPFTDTAVVLRDFHIDNLMLLPGRAGAAACGLLDFQDAAIGHPAYDLMSLVEDARRDVSPSARAAALAAYGPVDEAAFAALGALRHARVAALWTRLDQRDGKPKYLAHGPRTWALLARSLSHQASAPLAAWFDRHVPHALRANPTPRAA